MFISLMNSLLYHFFLGLTIISSDPNGPTISEVNSEDPESYQTNQTNRPDKEL